MNIMYFLCSSICPDFRGKCKDSLSAKCSRSSFSLLPDRKLVIPEKSLQSFTQDINKNFTCLG